MNQILIGTAVKSFTNNTKPLLTCSCCQKIARVSIIFKFTDSLIVGKRKLHSNVEASAGNLENTEGTQSFECSRRIAAGSAKLKAKCHVLMNYVTIHAT